MGQAVQFRSLPLMAILLGVVAIVAIACGSSSSGSEPTTVPPTQTPDVSALQQQLDLARSVWEQNRPVSYELVLSPNCFFCAFNDTDVKIIVTDNEVVRAFDINTGEPFLIDRGRITMTVDEMFDWIQTALDNPETKRVIELEYDSELRFPTTVSIDERVGATDTTLFMAITEFREFTESDQPQIIADLEAARTRWAANMPGSYSFDITWSCFCSYEGNITRVGVEGDRVVSAVDPATGAARGQENGGPSVSFGDLFSQLSDALDESAARVLDVEFEADIGYPMSASIDQQVGAGDATISYRITNFKPGTQITDLERLRSELDSAMFRWFDSGSQSYEFVFRWECFCLPEVVTPVRVRVEGGRIVSTVNTVTGEPIMAPDGLEYRTVSDLFGWISERIARNPEFVALEFDTTSGYPISARFNPIIRLFDDEQAFFIEDLEPLDIHEELQTRLDDARALWASAAPANYSYRFNWQCFCIQDFTALVTVAVEDGRVTSVIRVEDGEPVSDQFRDDFVTVDELFDRIQDAIDRSAASIRAEFDPDTGLPTEVFIDSDVRIADEEIGWNASAVTELE